MLPPHQKDCVPYAGWSDDHEDTNVDRGTTEDYGDPLWERPQQVSNTRFVPRIGVTSPVRGLTRPFVIATVTWLVTEGRTPLILTCDTHGWDEAIRLRAALTGILDAARIVGVVAGRELDHGLPAAVASELTTRFPDADVLLYAGYATTAPTIRSATLVHYAIDIRDGTSTAPDFPRSVDLAGLHVIHSTAAEATHANMQISHAHLSGLPTIVADCIGGQGLDAAFAVLWDEVLG